jgi:hypothetical protein
MMHSVPTETGSIQGETGSFRPFVAHPLCSLARPAAEGFDTLTVITCQ